MHPENGLISANHIRQILPDCKNNELLIMLCGSKQMTRDYLTPLIKNMNYSNDNIFNF